MLWYGVVYNVHMYNVCDVVETRELLEHVLWWGWCCNHRIGVVGILTY